MRSTSNPILPTHRQHIEGNTNYGAIGPAANPPVGGTPASLPLGTPPAAESQHPSEEGQSSSLESQLGVVRRRPRKPQIGRNIQQLMAPYEHRAIGPDARNAATTVSRAVVPAPARYAITTVAGTITDTVGYFGGGVGGAAKYVSSPFLAAGNAVAESPFARKTGKMAEKFGVGLATLALQASGDVIKVALAATVTHMAAPPIISGVTVIVDWIFEHLRKDKDRTTPISMNEMLTFLDKLPAGNLAFLIASGRLTRIHAQLQAGLDNQEIPIPGVGNGDKDKDSLDYLKFTINQHLVPTVTKTVNQFVASIKHVPNTDSDTLKIGLQIARKNLAPEIAKRPHLKDQIEALNHLIDNVVRTIKNDDDKAKVKLYNLVSALEILANMPYGEPVSIAGYEKEGGDERRLNEITTKQNRFIDDQDEEIQEPLKSFYIKCRALSANLAQNKDEDSDEENSNDIRSFPKAILAVINEVEGNELIRPMAEDIEKRVIDIHADEFSKRVLGQSYTNPKIKDKNSVTPIETLGAFHPMIESGDTGCFLRIHHVDFENNDHQLAIEAALRDDFYTINIPYTPAQTLYEIPVQRCPLVFVSKEEPTAERMRNKFPIVRVKPLTEKQIKANALKYLGKRRAEIEKVYGLDKKLFNFIDETLSREEVISFIIKSYNEGKVDPHTLSDIIGDVWYELVNDMVSHKVESAAESTADELVQKLKNHKITSDIKSREYTLFAFSPDGEVNPKLKATIANQFGSRVKQDLAAVYTETFLKYHKERVVGGKEPFTYEELLDIGQKKGALKARDCVRFTHNILKKQSEKYECEMKEVAEKYGIDCNNSESFKILDKQIERTLNYDFDYSSISYGETKKLLMYRELCAQAPLLPKNRSHWEKDADHIKRENEKKELFKALDQFHPVNPEHLKVVYSWLINKSFATLPLAYPLSPAVLIAAGLHGSGKTFLFRHVLYKNYGKEIIDTTMTKLLEMKNKPHPAMDADTPQKLLGIFYPLFKTGDAALPIHLEEIDFTKAAHIDEIKILFDDDPNNAHLKAIEIYFPNAGGAKLKISLARNPMSGTTNKPCMDDAILSRIKQIIFDDTSDDAIEAVVIDTFNQGMNYIDGFDLEAHQVQEIGTTVKNHIHIAIFNVVLRDKQLRSIRQAVFNMFMEALTEKFGAEYVRSKRAIHADDGFSRLFPFPSPESINPEYAKSIVSTITALSPAGAKKKAIAEELVKLLPKTNEAVTEENSIRLRKTLSSVFGEVGDNNNHLANQLYSNLLAVQNADTRKVAISIAYSGYIASALGSVISHDPYTSIADPHVLLGEALEIFSKLGANALDELNAFMRGSSLSFKENFEIATQVLRLLSEQSIEQHKKNIDKNILESTLEELKVIDEVIDKGLKILEGSDDKKQGKNFTRDHENMGCLLFGRIVIANKILLFSSKLPALDHFFDTEQRERLIAAEETILREVENDGGNVLFKRNLKGFFIALQEAMSGKKQKIAQPVFLLLEAVDNETIFEKITSEYGIGKVHFPTKLVQLKEDSIVLYPEQEKNLIETFLKLKESVAANAFILEDVDLSDATTFKLIKGIAEKTIKSFKVGLRFRSGVFPVEVEVPMERVTFMVKVKKGADVNNKLPATIYRGNFPPPSRQIQEKRIRNEITTQCGLLELYGLKERHRENVSHTLNDDRLIDAIANKITDFKISDEHIRFLIKQILDFICLPYLTYSDEDQHSQLKENKNFHMDKKGNPWFFYSPPKESLHDEIQGIIAPSFASFSTPRKKSSSEKRNLAEALHSIGVKRRELSGDFNEVIIKREARARLGETLSDTFVEAYFKEKNKSPLSIAKLTALVAFQARMVEGVAKPPVDQYAAIGWGLARYFMTCTTEGFSEYKKFVEKENLTKCESFAAVNSYLIKRYTKDKEHSLDPFIWGLIDTQLDQYASGLMEGSYLDEFLALLQARLIQADIPSEKPTVQGDMPRLIEESEVLERKKIESQKKNFLRSLDTEEMQKSVKAIFENWEACLSGATRASAAPLIVVEGEEKTTIPEDAFEALNLKPLHIPMKHLKGALSSAPDTVTPPSERLYELREWIDTNDAGRPIIIEGADLSDPEDVSFILLFIPDSLAIFYKRHLPPLSIPTGKIFVAVKTKNAPHPDVFLAAGTQMIHLQAPSREVQKERLEQEVNTQLKNLDRYSVANDEQKMERINTYSILPNFSISLPINSRKTTLKKIYFAKLSLLFFGKLRSRLFIARRAMTFPSRLRKTDLTMTC